MTTPAHGPAAIAAQLARTSPLGALAGRATTLTPAAAADEFLAIYEAHLAAAKPSETAAAAALAAALAAGTDALAAAHRTHEAAAKAAAKDAAALSRANAAKDDTMLKIASTRAARAAASADEAAVLDKTLAGLERKLLASVRTAEALALSPLLAELETARNAELALAAEAGVVAPAAALTSAAQASGTAHRVSGRLFEDEVVPALEKLAAERFGAGCKLVFNVDVRTLLGKIPAGGSGELDCVAGTVGEDGAIARVCCVVEIKENVNEIGAADGKLRRTLAELAASAQTTCSVDGAAWGGDVPIVYAVRGGRDLVGFPRELTAAVSGTLLSAPFCCTRDVQAGACICSGKWNARRAAHAVAVKGIAEFCARGDATRAVLETIDADNVLFF